MLGDRRATPAHENAGVKNPPHSPSRTARRQGGFTLIEVMVALIVLVLGVLGAAAMTLTALKDNKQSALRSQASALAYELADIMRSSQPPRLNDTFIADVSTTTPACWTSGCNPTAMAQNELAAWKQKVADVLPNGVGKVCRDVANAASSYVCDGLATSNVVVKLQWEEKNNVSSDASLGANNFATPTTTRVLTVPVAISY